MARNVRTSRAGRASTDLRPVRTRRSGGRSTAEQRDTFDYNLLAAVILLTCFGLVMLCSAGAYTAGGSDGMATFIKQAAFSAVGVVIMLIVANISYHVYDRWVVIAYIFSLGMLFITRFLGRNVNGATRGLYMGSFSLQPGEIAKLALILFMPYVVLTTDVKELKGWRGTIRLMVPSVIAGFCTYYFVQNLSTALIIIGMGFIVTFVVDKKTRPYIIGILAFLALLIFARIFILPMITDAGSLDSFRIRRIRVWLDPESYASGTGYQTLQGLYALGSGGFMGKGLGKSIQKINKLPEAQNDMIFSIICEELGIFGALVVIGLFVFMLYRLYRIAESAPDLTGSLIACGIFSHISLQVILNIAVVTNTIPNTGITLPFISSGGSSIVFTMIEMGIALNISRQQSIRQR